jgi:hypothetical protein
VGSAAAAAAADEQQGTGPAAAWISPQLLRKVTAAADANEALDSLCEELSSSSGTAALPALTEAQCRDLLLACLDRGNSALAQSIHRAMSARAAAAAAGPGSAAASASMSSLDRGEWAPGGGSGAANGGLRWPPASIQTAAALVVGLSRVLQTREAIALINSVRSRGLASSDDVNFGHVVGCPQDRWVLGCLCHKMWRLDFLGSMHTALRLSLDASDASWCCSGR